MTVAIPQEERDDRIVSVHTPFLSHSRVSRYLHCPEQYRLYYLENLRRRIPAANLLFGQVVHQALAAFFQRQADPVRVFQEFWHELKTIDLEYGAKDSWEVCLSTGQGLLSRFLQDEVPRLRNVEAVEQKFELQITTLDLPFVGIIDLVVHVDDRRSVVDFKTAGSGYQPHEAALSDQLTAYLLAEPTAEQAGLYVFVKTKEPRIEWHVARRTGTQLAEYLDKTNLVAHEIALGHFYKRPGKWCSWCDYLPVCMGDREVVEKTLVKIR